MIWLNAEQSSQLKSFFTKYSPQLLLMAVVLIIGYTVGYSVKGDEIMRDCKYAQAFRVGIDSFGCARRV